MKSLILVKHSQSMLKPGTPPHLWQLSMEGEDHCKPLAEKLSQYAPEVIVSSQEAKARQTAEFVAKDLGLVNEVIEGLQEHNRSNEPFYDLDMYETRLRTFFAKPDELTFGLENANQARERFSRAINVVQQRFADQTTVVVAHGTVITLYVSQIMEIDLYDFWNHLEMPAFVVISEGTVTEVVASVI